MKKAILVTLALTVLGGCLPSADCRTESMCLKKPQIGEDYDADNDDGGSGGGSYDGGSGGGSYDGGNAPG